MHLKDKGRKGMIASFGVTALCGVTEPAFYGSLIMRPRVLVGTAIGAAAGGLIAGIFQLKNYVVGGCPGFLALLFFLPPDGSMGNMIVALASGHRGRGRGVHRLHRHPQKGIQRGRLIPV